MRVFICDDHKMFAEALATVLTREGHQATTFYEPDDIVECATTDPPDACLIDLHYGHSRDDGPGVRAIRAISTNTKSSPYSPALIAMTGAFEQAQVDACDGAGAHAFVVKAIDVRDLERVIKRAMVERVFFAMTPTGERTCSRSATASGARFVISSLTPREKLVLESLVRGEPTPTLCSTLAISRSTARTHVQHVLSKLGVHSRLEAVALAQGFDFEQHNE